LKSNHLALFVNFVGTITKINYEIKSFDYDQSTDSIIAFLKHTESVNNKYFIC